MHKDYDRLLAVKTKNIGMNSDLSEKYNPYEATPYSILHALFNEYKLEETDVFVDFGSGKGRLLFYVHNLFGSSVTGIEMDQYLYKKTVKNKQKYLQKIKRKNDFITVERCYAEDYDVKAIENKFYFFNPFSVTIFAKVINNIIKSVEVNKRDVDVILYYPIEDYIEYLEEHTEFKCIQEVKVPGLYNINQSERFLIYRLEHSGISRKNDST